MVDGIGPDIVSDITTNLIRRPLIAYTQKMCDQFDIPTIAVDSGPLWQPHKEQFGQHFVRLPAPRNRKLLLVPKIIVRTRMDYDPDEYYRHYLLTHLQSVHLDERSDLVRLLRSGEARVYKKDLEERYGRGKKVIVDLTHDHPEVLDRYRRSKEREVQSPLDHYDFSVFEGTSPPDWDALLTDVTTIRSGNANATDFHRAVEKLLTALFYPQLAFPEIEREIHAGRKRIDLVYTNTAKRGFFNWLADNFRAPYIFVECKNYGGDPANPELDQLSGRFSRRRGEFGLLVCRRITDKDLFTARCRDTANDGRGYVVALDDADLKTLVDEQRGGSRRFDLLRERFDALVF